MRMKSMERNKKKKMIQESLGAESYYENST